MQFMVKNMQFVVKMEPLGIKIIPKIWMLGYNGRMAGEGT